MTEQPNILILLSDEHSYRFLSSRSPAQGGEPCHTPTLDGLAAQGARFDAACCHAPVCITSRTSLLTGRYISRNPALWPEIPTLASHFGANGYATATVGKMHLLGSRQFAGFSARPYGDFTAPSPAHQKDPLFLPGRRDHIFMPSVIEDAGLSDIPESLLQEQIVIRESMAWLREQRHSNPDQPWLLYASFAHPHFPMNAPRRFFDRYYPDGVTPPRVGRESDAQNHPAMVGALHNEGAECQGHPLADVTDEQTRRARAAYFACVDQLDEMLGDFLALLTRDGLLDNTIVVYMSDHGELAGEHGLWFKRTWHEASVRIPLIISLPEHRQGESSATVAPTVPPIAIDEPVSLLDIFPTLCGLANLAKPEGLDGVDLAPKLRGLACPELDARPGVIIEQLERFNTPGTEYRMIRSAQYKYVAFNGCDDLAYDLIADPDEQHNLLTTERHNEPELMRLRDALLDGFNFDESLTLLQEERRAYDQRYPARISPQTSNQIMRGDGMLVEADGALEMPTIVSEDPRFAFDDFPQSKRADRRRR